MPDFSAKERDVLSAEELALSTASRQPQLRGHSDKALAALIDDLRAALALAAAQEAEARPAPQPDQSRARYLDTALRRAIRERNQRRSKAKATG